MGLMENQMRYFFGFPDNAIRGPGTESIGLKSRLPLLVHRPSSCVCSCTSYSCTAFSSSSEQPPADPVLPVSENARSNAGSEAIEEPGQPARKHA